MSCIFCDIANETMPVDFLFNDEYILAFHDIKPQAPHHVLIIPKEHIPSIHETDNSHTILLGHMMTVARDLACDLGIDQSGYRLVVNCNEEGGQEVSHIHLHLLGGRQMTWPPG